MATMNQEPQPLRKAPDPVRRPRLTRKRLDALSEAVGFREAGEIEDDATADALAAASRWVSEMYAWLDYRAELDRWKTEREFGRPPRGLLD